MPEPTSSARSSSNKQARLSPPNGGHFEAIIFDMGSTLLEFENVTWPVLYRFSFNSLYTRLRKLGHHPIPTEQMWERFNTLLDSRRERLRAHMREYQIGPLLKATVEADGLRLRPGELSQLCDAYYAAVRRQVSAYPDARATLAALKGAGYKIGLLSNTPFRAIDHRQELQHFGLWQYFDAAVFTSTIRYRKPHPAPFKEILRRLEAPASRSVYVGDRQKEDVLGPQGVGMTAVLIKRPHRTYDPELSQSAEICELAELLPLLGIGPSGG